MEQVCVCEHRITQALSETLFLQACKFVRRIAEASGCHVMKVLGHPHPHAPFCENVPASKPTIIDHHACSASCAVENVAHVVQKPRDEEAVRPALS